MTELKSHTFYRVEWWGGKGWSIFRDCDNIAMAMSAYSKALELYQVVQLLHVVVTVDEFVLIDGASGFKPAPRP